MASHFQLKVRSRHDIRWNICILFRDNLVVPTQCTAPRKELEEFLMYNASDGAPNLKYLCILICDCNLAPFTLCLTKCTQRYSSHQSQSLRNYPTNAVGRTTTKTNNNNSLIYVKLRKAYLRLSLACLIKIA